MLRDNVTFSSGAIRELMELVMGPFVLVGMDEPEHKRHRGLVSVAFRHKSLVRWESDVIEPIMHDAHRRVRRRGARPSWSVSSRIRFPVQIIAEILGVPHEDHEQFHDMAVWVVNVAANPEKGIAASHDLRDYLSDDRRGRSGRNPGDDVISLLVQEELDGERLDDEEIFSFLRLLLPAGAETTYRATGSFLYGLLTNPDQLDALRDDRSLMPQAVEEAIRWESPLLITSRLGDDRHRDRRRRRSRRARWSSPNIGVGQPRRDPLGPRRRLRPVPARRSRTSASASVRTCASGMHLARMEMGGRGRRAARPAARTCASIPKRVERDDPHIHGERFRSPTSLPVIGCRGRDARRAGSR